MTTTSILESLGLLGADPAFQRASRNAQRIAAQTGTQLAVWRDGQVVMIAPDAATLASLLPHPPSPSSLTPRHSDAAAPE